MGTNPLRQDILVEYDWFDDSLDCAAHSHRPTAAAVECDRAVEYLRAKCRPNSRKSVATFCHHLPAALIRRDNRDSFLLQELTDSGFAGSYTAG